jgi:ActR/RegA family two-component response regulator
VRALQAVLRASGHNFAEAARRLGVHRSTIYRKLGRR